MFALWPTLEDKRREFEIAYHRLWPKHSLIWCETATKFTAPNVEASWQLWQATDLWFDATEHEEAMFP